MDERGPWTGHLIKPAQLDKKRFDLEWILPLEPGLSTHVTLYGLQCDRPHRVAVGHGGDEAEALLDLWTTLTDRNESADAIAFVTTGGTRMKFVTLCLVLVVAASAPSKRATFRTFANAVALLGPYRAPA
jgi:hypothetical protein